MIELLHYYTIAFQSLKRGPIKFGKAPHKPVLLLSIIDLIEDLKIIENRIEIDQSLKDKFNQNWQKLVNTDHDCDINKPLYHLQNDGFWTVIMLNGNKLDQARGISKIRYGQLDEPLFLLIQSKEYRPIFRMILLDAYFNDTQQEYLEKKPYPNYIAEIDRMIWEEPQQDSYRKVTRTIEGYVRNQKFQKAIMRLYDNTCCMSLMKMTPSIGIIEACHIKPHVLTGNSHPTNGIPLCRNLHRAFDGGLISINDSYEVVIKSEKIFKEADSPFNFRQLKGRQILLPKEKQFYPSLEQLSWHWKRHGF